MGGLAHLMHHTIPRVARHGINFAQALDTDVHRHAGGINRRCYLGARMFADVPNTPFPEERLSKCSRGAVHPMWGWRGQEANASVSRELHALPSQVEGTIS